jgi:hypothetical protein
MTTTQIVIAIIVVLVVLAAGTVIVIAARRAALRRRFGPEYDRAVAGGDGLMSAERELRARERRHGQLELRPLNDAAREQYAQSWRAVQTQFIIDPAAAVVAGDDLVTRLVADRGYPTTGYEDQLSYLSVEHARALGHYRDAHEIYLRGQRGEASTEELRQALVHYRELFADLLDESSEAIVDTQAGNRASENGSNPDGPATESPSEDRTAADIKEAMRHA